MFFTLKCPDCGKMDEFSQGSDDTHVVVQCACCGTDMTRKENRHWQSDVPDIRGETCAGNRQVSYEYMDPTLGWIKNRQDRKDKMAARGLVDYEPNPEMHKHRVEAKRIRSQANPAGDKEAAKAISKEHKAAGTKRRRVNIKKAFDDADKSAGII